MIGNKYCSTGPTREDVRASLEGLGIRFTAPKTGEIDKVGLFLMWSFEAGKPEHVPQYSVGMYEDDGLGKPSKLLGEGIFGGDTEWKNHVGWEQKEIPPVHVEAGRIYHIIEKVLKWFEPPHLALVLEGEWCLRSGHFGFIDWSKIIPRTQVGDMALITEKYDGRYHLSWDTYAQQPAFIVVYDDGDVYGNPYAIPLDWHLGKRDQPKIMTQAVAQVFEVAQDETIRNLALWLKRKGSPVDNLYVSLFSHDLNTYLLQDVPFVDPIMQVSTSYKWCSKKIGALTLAKGIYRLEMKSPNCRAYENNYITRVYRCEKNTPEVAKAAFYGGARQSQDNGLTWSDFGAPSDFSFMLY